MIANEVRRSEPPMPKTTPRRRYLLIAPAVLVVLLMVLGGGLGAFQLPNPAGTPSRLGTGPLPN